MNAIDHLENTCADAWPALVDQPLGQWRMRAAGGFTGRANSVLTIGDPGIEAREALWRAQRFAVTHRIAATAHVVRGSAAESAVRAAGWAVNDDHAGGAESMVMAGAVAGMAGSVPEGTAVHVRVPAGWWPLAVGADAPNPAQRHVLTSGEHVGFGAATVDGRVVGVVRGAVVGDLLHISRLAVADGYRRRGIARGLLSALAAWSTRGGATGAVLQVAAHNQGAINLYRGLGCAEHHRYRYWVPAA